MLSNQRHKVYPGSGRGPYVQQWRARGHYIAQHRGACSGVATSKAGEKAWPRVPGEVAEDVVGELECVWGVSCVVLCALSPAAGEFTFLL
jgi:hypothetical protein